MASDSAIVAAWGAHGALGDAAPRFLARAASRRVALLCLGETRDGHPRHPLYVRASTGFTLFEKASKP